MKVMSWNVRGLGRKEKRGKIKKLVFDRKVESLMMQETKRRSMNDCFVRSLWPSENI